ncbi:NUDIX hydrolase domain-like protein [Pilobolus umbonatus]|nr:NUDIX hydrolase domain-like protein [Pilobolus umbonatus]
MDNTHTNYPDESRIGRDQQVYDDDLRQIAGCIAIDHQQNKVLLISSSKHEDVWVLPKGGWENDETKEEAAIRETYEEAGVKGRLVRLVGNYINYDSYGYPKGVIWFYELEVKTIMECWPEMDFRERKWCTLDEALYLLRFKPFMQQALMNSSLATQTSL